MTRADLNSADLGQFRRIGVSPDLLKLAQVRRVTDCEARRDFGITFEGDLSGVVFPYLNPITGYRATARLRRDNPETNSEGKPENKYVCPFGDNRHLYFPPGVRDLLNDAGVPLVIVEAEKSSLALVALVTRHERRLLAVATGGCWGWRGKTGIETGPNGERAEVRGPSPDFSLLALKGRKALIAFDSNVASNSKVRSARQSLAHWLAERGAKVSFVTLPEEAGVNGPDDFIAIYGDEPMLARLDGARAFKRIPSMLASEVKADLVGHVQDFVGRFVTLPTGCLLPVSVWITATHAFDSFQYFPYLAILSAVKGCGKTRLLQVLECLCHNPSRYTFPSAAVLYRTIQDRKPTLLLDEVENLSNPRSEVAKDIRAILNAGFEAGGKVPRCGGKRFDKIEDFSVYCPKAFAAIGNLPDTIADRSIVIHMQRQRRSEAVERFTRRRVAPQAQALKAEIATRVAKAKACIVSAYEESEDLEFLKDREADCWLSLFAVCSVLSPERVDDLRECALLLSGQKTAADIDDSVPTRLLADIKTVWPNGSPHAFSRDLLAALRLMEDSPWAEEIPLTTRKLARMLGPFGIKSGTVRVEGETGKGYRREDFEAVFSRYLTAETSQASQPA